MNREYVLYYEQLEANHWWWKARKKILLDLMLHKQHSPEQTLLDVGCGAGILLRELEEYFSCYGIEPDPFLANQARKNTAKATILPGSLPYQIPHNLPQFDYIILADVLEHIKEDTVALQKIQELLKPEGILIINVPAHMHLWSKHDEDNNHFRRYSQYALSVLLTNSGLTDLNTHYWGHLLAPIVFFARKMIPKFLKASGAEIKIPNRMFTALLTNYVYFEYRLTRNLNIPWGLSLIALCKRNNVAKI